QSNSIDHLLKICAHRYRAVAARLTEHIAYFVQKGICTAIVFSKIVKVYQEILANFIVQGKDVRVKELLHKVLKKLTYVDTYARTHTNIFAPYNTAAKANAIVFDIR
uniref:Uncharacterized protein n=1 Tax=Glossina palpalis gambiensis TaxID=67801 RepID=A0A1B0B3N8_9MUSC